MRDRVRAARTKKTPSSFSPSLPPPVPHPLVRLTQTAAAKHWPGDGESCVQANALLIGQRLASKEVEGSTVVALVAIRPDQRQCDRTHRASSANDRATRRTSRQASGAVNNVVRGGRLSRLASGRGQRLHNPCVERELRRGRPMVCFRSDPLTDPVVIDKFCIKAPLIFFRGGIER